MPRNRILWMGTILLALSSCAKQYTPKVNDLNSYVVSGQVTMGAQTQTVNISLNTPINDPTYTPATGCKVTIWDNANHDFPMVDLGDGNYSTMVDPKYLVPGHVFKLNIVTPSGDSIISDYDTLQRVPPVDSIYYLVKDSKSPNTGQTEKGLQFYINLQGTNTDSRYYRWAIYETWEYHSKYPLEYYWDGELHRLDGPDYSTYTCWDTKKIPEIFTLSTHDLSQNKYVNFSLQFVSSSTPKLANGYSMLVEQYALSKVAYNYWEKMESNSSQVGGAYTKQPVTIRGNLHDITHPDKIVLGFFSAESASQKRIFVPPVTSLLTLHYNEPCDETLLPGGYYSIPKSLYPAPIKADPVTHAPLFIELSPMCINCLLQGGDTIKPSFWPKGYD